MQVSVTHAQAAVHRQHGSADVRRGVRGEEPHRGGDLVRLANRPAGMALTYAALVSLGQAAVMSVSMKPGATTFAVMPRPPSSRVTDRAIPTRPALLAA